MTRPLIVAAAVLLSVACDDAAGTVNATCPNAQVPLCMKADSVLAIATPMTNDATARSGAVLANQAVKATITTELATASAALSSGQVTQARAAVERARAAIAAALAANTHPGDAPDLTAIDLALIQLGLALK